MTVGAAAMDKDKDTTKRLARCGRCTNCKSQASCLMNQHLYSSASTKAYA